MTNNQITLILAAIGSFIILALNESIKELIKKLFSNLNSKQITIIFICLIGLVFGLISITGISFFGEKSNSSDMNDQSAIIKSHSDAEVYADLTKLALEKGEKLLDNKQIKDSIRIANRDKFWVYQIGIARSSESEAWEAAQALDGIDHIYIFKESRKSYLVVWDNNYDRKMSEDSLENFKASADSILLGNRVKVVDIMGLCPKRKKLKETDQITKKKRPEIFRCVTCD